MVTDLPCRQCGYNVRGLPPSGACPECGTQVAMSLRGDLLRYCQPEWVHKLRRGVQLILWDIVLVIIAAVAGGIAGAMSGGQQGNGMMGAQLLGVVAAIVGFIGSWWLTEPDPSGLGEDQYGTVRKVIRVTLLLGIAQTVLNLMVSWAGALPPWARITAQAVGVVLGIASVVGAIATLQYLRRLSMRIPDDRIAARANFLAYALGSCYGAVVLLGAVTLVLVGTAASQGIVAVGCIGGLVLLAMIVFGVMYLFMLINLYRRLAEQAAAAEQIWGQPASGTLPPPPIPPSGAPGTLT